MEVTDEVRFHYGMSREDAEMLSVTEQLSLIQRAHKHGIGNGKE